MAPRAPSIPPAPVLRIGGLQVRYPGSEQATLDGLDLKLSDSGFCREWDRHLVAHHPALDPEPAAVAQAGRNALVVVGDPVPVRHDQR